LGRKARGIVGVAVTLGGLGLAACRPDSSQEPLSPTTTSGTHIVRVEPEPTISTSEMILKSEPNFIISSAIGKSGQGGESLTKMIADRQDEIREIKEIMAQEANEGNLYPHDVFLARYYVLGDPKDLSPQSPVFSPTRQTTAEADLKRLISKIAFDLWYADHVVLQALIMAEQSGRDPFGSPKYLHVS